MEKLWNSNYLKIWVVNFLIHTSFSLIVPLLPLYLSETYGASKDTIGLVLAGYAVVALMIRPVSGFLCDRFSRKMVLLCCNFLFAALFIGYIASASLTLFAIFRTLHGAPFGAATVTATTVAVDVLPASRRTEGIGYYGISNNLAMVLGPVFAIYLLRWFHQDFNLLFTISLLFALVGLLTSATIRMPRQIEYNKTRTLSLNNFFLKAALPAALAMCCFSFSYGVVSTYVAIYVEEVLQLEEGVGFFFSLFAVGLIVSRLGGAKALAKGRILSNATLGCIFALLAYVIFAAVPNSFGLYSSAFILGLGNGHMYPAFQNMFVNLAEHNQRGTANSSILTAWDAGLGIGVLCGGFFAEYFGYDTAFWVAVAVNACGAVYYYFRVRPHYLSHRLR